MAYTPPVTFTSGSTLDAADLRANQDALRQYVERVDAADLSSTPWCSPRHLPPARVFSPPGPVSWRWQAVQGCVGATWFGYGSGNMSYAAAAPSASSSDRMTVVPLTGITFYVRRDAIVRGAFWAHPAGRDDLDGVLAECELRAYLGPAPRSGSLSYEVSRIPEEDSSDPFRRLDRRAVAGFWAKEITAARGELHFGLAALAQQAKVAFLSYGAILEVYYL